MPTPKATSLKAGQALVKILYAGVCHSDVALALGKGTHRPIEPVISGHEGTGYIVALGDHVRPGPGSSIGDRVGIKFIADTCGTCDACLSGNEESCETVRSLNRSLLSKDCADTRWTIARGQRDNSTRSLYVQTQLYQATMS